MQGGTKKRNAPWQIAKEEAATQRPSNGREAVAAEQSQDSEHVITKQQNTETQRNRNAGRHKDTASMEPKSWKHFSKMQQEQSERHRQQTQASKRRNRAMQYRAARTRHNKSQNTGITSVDRSTKATLSTYNTQIHISRLQKIYHFQCSKLRLATQSL